MKTPDKSYFAIYIGRTLPSPLSISEGITKDMRRGLGLRRELSRTVRCQECLCFSCIDLMDIISLFEIEYPDIILKKDFAVIIRT